jgi:lipid II:glycine glycyltransferase (peptidoglycan interpeptide bridge formation enzyme)
VGQLLMLNWVNWSGDAVLWDDMLTEFPDYTVYQSHAWGEHKQNLGWIPYRFVAKDCGCAVSMALVLVRRLRFGVALAWVPGGPVGNPNYWDERLLGAIRETISARHVYLRINPMRSCDGEDVNQLLSQGWHRPSHRLISGLTMAYDPGEDEPAREKQASGNWRHNLRRSTKYGHHVIVWNDPDPGVMLGVYEAMQVYKSLAEQFSKAELISILESFKNHCVVVRCDDKEGSLLALRGALVFKRKGWDIFAAATPQARKVYASHGAFWELMRQCASRGVRWYDMSGIDPIGNKGVYDFKNGTGAKEFSYLGEWDRATSGALRMIANFMIGRRGRGM